MSRAGVIALGKEKGFFPVLIDGDIDNNDDMTKKSAISGVDKDVTGLDICQWTELHLAAA